MSQITNVKEARAAIGTKVYWDDHGSRYVFLRAGIMEEVGGRNVCIDGNWHYRADLRSLRTTEKGGAFPDGPKL